MVQLILYVLGIGKVRVHGPQGVCLLHGVRSGRELREGGVSFLGIQV